MKTIATTERLILREFNEADHEFIIELLNTEGWLQFIGNRNILENEQAIDYINNALRASYSKNGYGLYCVELKSTGMAIGMCGFVKRENFIHADLGFAFLPDSSGKGLAYESAEAVLKYGFEKLQFSTVDAITKHENVRSISLLKRLTFQHIEDVEMNNEQLMLFRLKSELPQTN